MTKIALISVLLSSTAFATPELDRKENINGIVFESSKEGSTRYYHAQTAKNLSYPLKAVSKSILNFAERCNNSHRSLRKVLSPETNCKYHAENLVEAFLVTDFKQPLPQSESTQQFLLGKQVYNRGLYGYYELVNVESTKNSLGQSQILITQKMLHDDEVKRWTTVKVPQESSFKDSTVKYVLTETSPSTTRVDYYSDSQTEHWILNKELSVPQVFASLGSAIQELFRNVEQDSLLQRDIASETKE